jgi:hypothetical protein
LGSDEACARIGIVNLSERKNDENINISVPNILTYVLRPVGINIVVSSEDDQYPVSRTIDNLMGS